MVAVRRPALASKAASAEASIGVGSAAAAVDMIEEGAGTEVVEVA